MKVNSLFIAMMIGLVLFIVGCSKEEVEKPKETVSSLPEYTFEKDLFPPSPAGFVKIEEMRYEMARGGFEWRKGDQAVTTDAAAPTQIAETFVAIETTPSSEIEIEIEQNPHLRLFLWESDEKIIEVPLNETKMTLPEEAGRYIYEVRAAWENGEVSYTFVVEVKS